MVSLHGPKTHQIQSNRESGLGRFDIIIIPKDSAQLGIILELKSASAKEDLSKVSRAALKQIDEKRYTESFKARGIKAALKIGIGFCGKVFELSAMKEVL